MCRLGPGPWPARQPAYSPGRRSDGRLGRGARCAGSRATAGHDERHTDRSEPDQSRAPAPAPHDPGAGLDAFTGRRRSSTGTTSVSVFARIMGCPFCGATWRASELLHGSRGCGVCLRRCALGKRRTSNKILPQSTTDYRSYFRVCAILKPRDPTRCLTSSFGVVSPAMLMFAPARPAWPRESR